MLRRLLARELASVREALRRAGRALARAWARRPSATRTAAMAFVALALGAGALAVLAQARLPGRLPSEQDWAAVAALVERDARPGDAVAIAPPWAERARERLPASLPVFALERYAGEDLVGVRRLWTLSMDRAPGFSWRPELDLLARAARSDPPARVGAFEVSRHELAAPTLPLAFLPDRLQGAEVLRGGTRCAPDPSGAFRCEGAAVAREVREVGGAPRPCLVVQLEAGAPLSLLFPRTRVGRLVHGHAGALGAAAPLRISVVVDGQEAGSAELTGAGFAPFQVDTTRFGGEPRELALVLTTPGSGAAGGAAVCLDAMTLP